MIKTEKYLEVYWLTPHVSAAQSVQQGLLQFNLLFLHNSTSVTKSSLTLLLGRFASPLVGAPCCLDQVEESLQFSGLEMKHWKHQCHTCRVHAQGACAPLHLA